MKPKITNFTRAVFILLFTLSTIALGQENLTLSQALQSGKVRMSTTESGRAAGEILDLRLKNQTAEQLSIRIPRGTVFVPPNSRQVRMSVDPMTTEIPPQGTVSEKVTGVCVEYGVPVADAGEVTEDYKVFLPEEILKSPTPEDELIDLELQEQFTIERLEELQVATRIAEAATVLESRRELHTDLGERQRITVTQRAVWAYTERKSENPHDQDKLWADIDLQVKQTGGKQTPEQVDTLADNVWEDVNLVLKEADAQEAVQQDQMIANKGKWIPVGIHRGTKKATGLTLGKANGKPVAKRPDGSTLEDPYIPNSVKDVSNKIYIVWVYQFPDGSYSDFHQTLVAEDKAFPWRDASMGKGTVDKRKASVVRQAGRKLDVKDFSKSGGGKGVPPKSA